MPCLQLMVKKKNKMVTVGKVNAKTVLMLEVTCDWPNTAI